MATALSGCAGSRRFGYGPGRTDYPEPGPPGDPWAPYIEEAANRFQVPSRWIRAVMDRESGGREYRYGRPITSAAGAMGLMQLMPATYADMQAQNRLGGDPYAPRDNILAGSAYIRLMYSRYGAPGFLAAYNAGPQRLDDYMNSGRPLPNETVDYVASVAPALAMAPAPTSVPAPVPAFATTPAPAFTTTPAPAFTTASAPAFATVPAPAFAPVPAPAFAPVPGDAIAARGPRPGDAPPSPVRLAAFASRPISPLPASSVAANGAWAIQVGAYDSPAEAHFADTMARETATAQLSASRILVEPTSRFGGHVIYRARLMGLADDSAGAACDIVRAHGIPCMVVAPGR